MQQITVLVVVAVEVLPPQPEPKVAREGPRTVTGGCGIGGLTRVGRRVQDGDREARRRGSRSGG